MKEVQSEKIKWSQIMTPKSSCLHFQPFHWMGAWWNSIFGIFFLFIRAFIARNHNNVFVTDYDLINGTINFIHLIFNWKLLSHACFHFNACLDSFNLCKYIEAVNLALQKYYKICDAERNEKYGTQLAILAYLPSESGGR